jgi:hypothetical protein
MNFDQGELDLSGNGSEAGHHKWLLELEEKKRVFERRHGVIIGRRVRVQLVGELNALEGLIFLVPQKKSAATSKLKLSMAGREFTPTEIESIIRLEDG